MGNKIDLAGIRFGRLVALSDTGGRSKSGAVIWLCICDCGEQHDVSSLALRSGDSQSCGCLLSAVAAEKGRAKRTHGKSASDPTYTSWIGMRGRCLNQRNPKYARYGGRGISICDRWSDFSVFLADMGPRPAGMTLDRESVHGNYEPGNCRWATQATQQSNRSNNRMLRVDGVSMTLSDAARIKGLSPTLVSGRMSRGDSAERALRPTGTNHGVKGCE